MTLTIDEKLQEIENRLAFQLEAVAANPDSEYHKGVADGIIGDHAILFGIEPEYIADRKAKGQL